MINGIPPVEIATAILLASLVALVIILCALAYQAIFVIKNLHELMQQTSHTLAHFNPFFKAAENVGDKLEKITASPPKVQRLSRKEEVEAEEFLAERELALKIVELILTALTVWRKTKK